MDHFGYDDEIISAGYLHDTVEDTNTTIEQIQQLFGGRIAKLVLNASEPDKTLPWEERKLHTINCVKNNSIEDIAVVLADKIHNIEDLNKEINIQGLDVLKAFKRGFDKQLWYFEEIFNAVSSPENNKLPIIQRLGKSILNLKNIYSTTIENTQKNVL